MKSIEAFKFNLVIDCCTTPTLITAPTIGQFYYPYTIGQATPLDISLSGFYTSDNDCCGSFAPSVPIITPIEPTANPPPNLFTQLNDQITTQVSWSDLNSGSEGLYILSIQPNYPGECQNTSEKIEFLVEVINECMTATLEIDPPFDIFKPEPTISLTHTFSSVAAVLTWDTTVGIVASHPICGDLIQELVDVTKEKEQPLNEAMTFTSDATRATLSLVTDLKMDLGSLTRTYTLKLKVHYKDFPAAQVEEREFFVEIVDPCLTATFAIDENDIWFEQIEKVTLLQFVNYDVRTIEWNDSIVTKSLPVESDPCGAHTFELWQINMRDGS